MELSSAEDFELRIAPVRKRLGDATVRMLAYNGSVPGPTLRVRQGSEVVVDVVNEGDLEATVHWHGLRLENRFDGTHETQAPMPVGGSFTYTRAVPRPGRLLVPPAHPRGLRPGDGPVRQHPGRSRPTRTTGRRPTARSLLTLDDILLEDGKVAPFSRSETTHTAMGRFGNVLLVSGETGSGADAPAGEVVRLYLTNTANTRVFNVALPGARMKLVGGDSGRCEHEEFVEEVLLAPSERAVVDVLFDRAGPSHAGAPHAGPDLPARRRSP